GLVVNRELLDLGAVEALQASRKRLFVLARARLDAPVFARHEGLDLGIALADQAQRRALHAPGRQALLHLAPQQRRQVEADQIIERAPRLLRIDQRRGNLARV